MGVWNGVELDDLVLAGDPLTLRPLSGDDADTVYAAMQERRMHEFVPMPYPYTREAATGFVTDVAQAGRRAGTGVEAALVENVSGAMVGTAGLRLPGPRGVAAEIGYAVYPDAQGRGYAAEASRMLATWAFEHGVARVTIRCAVGNIASARSALAAGFRFDGVLRAEVLTPRGAEDTAMFGRLPGDAGTPIAPWLPALPAAGLTDGVVRLHEMTVADAGVHERATLNPDARRWQFSDRQPPAHEFTRVADRARLGWLVGPVAPLVIVDAATGDGAGTMALRDVGPPQVLNIGYGVLPEFRGRGFTGRALRLLADWAFGAAGIARLELGTKVGNVASQRAALAGGFTADGVRVARLRNPDGTFSDEARFARVNPRYVASRSRP